MCDGKGGDVTNFIISDTSRYPFIVSYKRIINRKLRTMIHILSHLFQLHNLEKSEE